MNNNRSFNVLMIAVTDKESTQVGSDDDNLCMRFVSIDLKADQDCVSILRREEQNTTIFK